MTKHSMQLDPVWRPYLYKVVGLCMTLVMFIIVGWLCRLFGISQEAIKAFVLLRTMVAIVITIPILLRIDVFLFGSTQGGLSNFIWTVLVIGIGAGIALTIWESIDAYHDLQRQSVPYTPETLQNDLPNAEQMRSVAEIVRKAQADRRASTTQSSK